jgi:hypothetical protein
VVRPAEWWTEFASPDNLDAREVYVGSVWQNHAHFAISIRIHYDLYTGDGRIFGNCDAVAEAVLPGERAWAFCPAAPIEAGLLGRRRLKFQIAEGPSTLTAAEGRHYPVSVESSGCDVREE